jgi:hypothetical protein
VAVAALVVAPYPRDQDALDFIAPEAPDRCFQGGPGTAIPLPRRLRKNYRRTGYVTGLSGFRQRMRRAGKCDWHVWHGALHVADMSDQLVECEFELRALIVWTKNNFAVSRGHYHWQHETLWYAVRKGQTAHWSGDRSQTTLWNIDMREACALELRISLRGIVQKKADIAGLARHARP